MSATKVSIITPSFNQGQYIEKTITSILDQHYPNLEYIIIDGGSTDNTVEIIKKYEKYLKFWVSEKDKGQANAINKGLKFCTGEIFNWVNSDDYLESGALLNIIKAFEDKNIDMVAGKVRNFSQVNEEIIQNQNLSAAGLLGWKPGVQFVQPGVWMRRDMIEKCGGIDESFQYAFDWDLYIRYLYHFPFVKEITSLVVHFRLHEQSKTQTLLHNFHKEEREIIEKISNLSGLPGIQKICIYNLQKIRWTEYLSELSGKRLSFVTKLFTVMLKMPSYKKVSFSRQTVGAFKAFWESRHI